MIWIVLILGGINLLLIIYLFLMKKELRNIIKQLKDYSNSKSKKKIDISLFNKDIENLAMEINENIDVCTSFQLKEIKVQEELRALIASISHDLRTPLTSIVGYLQMINKSTLSYEKQKEYLEITERRAKDLQDLLNEFFLLSVLESPEYTIKLNSINLNEILCDVITSCYYDFTNNNIEPDIHIKEENIMILGEESSVKRVLENLIINAVKHTKGRVVINLTKQSDKALLTIINSARNLKKKDEDFLFNKFYKGDKSRGLNKNSTGLGLAIVKELMNKMQGEITAEIKDELLYINCYWNVIGSNYVKCKDERNNL
ncbi:sensor histidine kinase [Clostridium tarantellae]|uniref:histidine kinase n=1 Tax=Clostridium tarantellae TaxID=39493 RepID=A0A6I1MPP9_9CLOT|nr:HAMP domain-containing sensor histidine kinase [Clostridium tarantellae]MPQ45044.1 GHKL domain-containing protein [Clostridium tarantellae]